MCRYAMSGPYKSHFACFRCRKGFKRRPEENGLSQPHAAGCPRCGEPMADMGLDFKPPPMPDVEHWQVVEHLFRRGFAYHSCGCGGPGYRPSRWADVPAFLRENRRSTPGERLAERFASRR